MSFGLSLTDLCVSMAQRACVCACVCEWVSDLHTALKKCFNVDNQISKLLMVKSSKVTLDTNYIYFLSLVIADRIGQTECEFERYEYLIELTSVCL